MYIGPAVQFQWPVRKVFRAYGDPCSSQRIMSRHDDHSSALLMQEERVSAHILVYLRRIEALAAAHTPLGIDPC